MTNAVRREELKYAHMAKRDTPARQANREALEAQIREAQDSVDE